MRKAVTRSLQALATGAALSGSIFIYKSIHEPAEFEKTGVIRPTTFSGHQPSAELLAYAESLGWGKSRISDAHRFCTGIEHSLAKLDSRESLRAALKKWESLKIDQPHLRRVLRDENGKLIYGCDAGTAPPTMFSDRRPTIPIDQAVNALETDGLVLLKSVIPLSEVENARKSLGIKRNYLGEGTSNFHTRAVPVDDLAASHPDAELDDVVYARPHVLLRNSPHESTMLSLAESAMPVVWEALRRQRNDTLLAEMDRFEPIPESRANDTIPRPYISDVQMVCAHSCAAKMPWSCDNGNGGLTVIIPLTAHTEEHGAHLFLPGTHRLRDGPMGWLYGLTRSLQYKGATEYVPQPGDVIVCDGRLMKRERANGSFHLCEAAVVVRFDFSDAKPPGQNPFSATGYNAIAGLIDFCGWIYQRVP